jgi:hypothetical protein
VVKVLIRPGDVVHRGRERYQVLRTGPDGVTVRCRLRRGYPAFERTMSPDDWLDIAMGVAGPDLDDLFRDTGGES